jgi:DUF971 family protein
MAVSDSNIERGVTPSPINLDLKKDESLTVTWADGSVTVFPIVYLRRMSPSAEARQLREDMKKNPLMVLPDSAISSEPLVAVGADLVGNYAIRVTFSDGHDTGIYSWDYLHSIIPPGSGA